MKNSNKLAIALIGSRGIPATYGGSEVVTEELAMGLRDKGFSVYVVCEDNKFFVDEYKGVKRIHIRSIQSKNITIPTINDVIATFYLLSHYPEVKIYCFTNFDIAPMVFLLKLFKKKVLLNTDGIEWKRPLKRKKYLSPFWKLISYLGSSYLRWTEWLAVRDADVVLADSKEIKKYLEKSYKAKKVEYVTYGARKLLSNNLSLDKEMEILDKYGLKSFNYYLIVGRLVAENNIDLVIKGYLKSNSPKYLVIVGNLNAQDNYCKYLLTLRKDNQKIIFLNPIYDKELLGVLRKNCFSYIHSYEVGGTNPSLLEQLWFERPIIANDVSFHREVLEEGGIYFKDCEELGEIIRNLDESEKINYDFSMIYKKRVEEEYNWDIVVQKYKILLDLFEKNHK